MSSTSPLKPALTLSKTDARRFMLAHHQLWPPRQNKGKQGVLAYIDHVKSIQFDPINIVGRNPDLVLQSRVQDYASTYLDQLLYEDRSLIDGWDKMACIHATTDWPFFNRRRDHLRNNEDPRKPPDAILNEVLSEVQKNGPLSSLDLKDREKIDWFWGPTKAGRAALEYLYAHGRVGVHHRINNRRYFDLIENLLPEDLLNAPDPFESETEYRDWHVYRRIGSLGLALSKTSEYWGGIIGVKTPQRQAALNRLVAEEKVIPVSVEDISNQILFIRSKDYSVLSAVQNQATPEPKAALIAPLDNLIWNRKLIEEIFNFSYTWEVYKPKAKRQYGYYVLPVLYGDRFVARLDPAFDKKKRILTLQNWWWEADLKPGREIQNTLLDCLCTFANYLDAVQVVLSEPILSDSSMAWMKKLC